MIQPRFNPRRGRAVSLATAVAALVLAAGAAAAEEAYVLEMSSRVLRGAPEGGAPIVGRVQAGERVSVVERASGWVRVGIGDRAGWLPDSAVASEPPAAAGLGALQEQVAGLEARLAEGDAQKTALREENARLGARVNELERSLEQSGGAVAAARTSVRLREMALGGGLVILGWLAGFAFAALRRGRRGATRYEIG